MRRTLLRSRNQEGQSSENIDSTPLRGNSVRFPRLRLLEQDDLQSDGALQNPVSSCHTSRHHSRVIQLYPLQLPKQTYPGDRFIPPRYNHSKEAAYYILTKTDQKTSLHKLDVFKQVNSLATSWRKKQMQQLMAERNVIPGSRQKHVLRGSHLSMESKSPGNFAGQFKDLWDEECLVDGMWKSKPRKKPLIGTMESILDMPGFQTLPGHGRHHLIDWSSRNVIAARIQDSLMFYNTHNFQAEEALLNFDAVDVSIIKWSGAGTKVALCTLSSELKLYDAEREKIMWSQKCTSVTTRGSQCYIRCVCWSQNDQHIVAGYEGLIMVYLAQNGELVDTTQAHELALLSLAFSRNYRYLASSALDMDVHIFLWPTMTPFLNIYYYEPVKALAWHPHDNNTLCIGGGVGDGSLLLWDVSKVDGVSYRLIRFHGSVENLAWNKRSGELVVHWSYRRRQNRYTVMPVFANLDLIVDVVPVDKKTQVNTILWNQDYTQLAVQHDESLTIWNFFGNEYQYHLRCKKQRKPREVQKKRTATSFGEFKSFNIR